MTTMLRLLIVVLAGLALMAAAGPLAAAPPAQDTSGEAAGALAPAPLPAPVLAAPAAEAITSGADYPPLGMPALSWAPVDGASRYHVQISASAGFAKIEVESDTYATSYTPVKALADGSYYWRVKAGRSALDWGPYSESRAFHKDWSAAGTIVPQLLAPGDGETRGSFGAGEFTWSAVPGAATYRFEIGPDPAFSSGSVAYSATATAARHTPAARLANNLYYWRVTPIDNRGHFGAPSAAFALNVDWNPAPQLLGPEHGASLPFVPRFAWTAVEGASQYTLQISTQPDLSAATTYNTRNTEYTPAQALSNDQDYYWRVRASNSVGQVGPWSEVRRFRAAWNFAPQLLTPANGSTRLSFPFFSWTPVPGAERYQIQIDESNAFQGSLIADVKVFNATSYAHPQWSNAMIDGDYFWRVRALDARGNNGPWSEVRSFRSVWAHGPNPVYPLHYYAPDPGLLPVHTDRSIAWPVFVWDSGHATDPGTGRSTAPDYYELAVDDDPGFFSPNFTVQTAGLAAAPTAANPFTGLEDGRVYYWRVRAFQGGSEIGFPATWAMRYASNAGELPYAAAAEPIYPAEGFEAVGTPPVLGWLPVAGSPGYQVQVSRDPAFVTDVEEALAQFANYVPGQGSTSPVSFGTYWWRVRANLPGAGWSEARHYNLSLDVVAGNPTDFVPPANILNEPLTHVETTDDAGLGAYELGKLHAMVDRNYGLANNVYYWVFAFSSGAGAGDSLRYGLYFDTDHISGSGGTADPRKNQVSADALYLPEYVLYVERGAGNVLDAGAALLYRWNGSGWDPGQALASIGGSLSYDETSGGVQVLLPYAAIGSADPGSVGSVAVTVFSVSTEPEAPMMDSIPRQGASINRPAFVSDMLMPLYPFDTPPSNPMVHYDAPAMRWRAPSFDSIDGYQVEVARDRAFTDVALRWESYESSTHPYFALLPTAFQPTEALSDNESYYWRVRIRHERYASTFYDYGPWSPPMRFKLDSRRPANLTPPPGATTGTTPTFSWDRVEGASGYTIQIDNDANFSSPLVDQAVDGTSYTPTDMSSSSALADGTYYWRVAMRRSSSVIGHWTAGEAFVKNSPWPAPVSPIGDALVSEQPALVWSALLAPEGQPRLASPRYRLQVDDDPNFGSPSTYASSATAFTPAKGQSMGDGTWFWRVALLDGNNRTGPYSPAQRFYKEYRPPVLVSPAQGDNTGGLPTFVWQAVPGAAYYRIEIADNPLFNKAVYATTDNTTYTPTADLDNGSYYWRVQMYDADGKPGPFEVGRVSIGHRTWLPCVTK